MKFSEWRKLWRIDKTIKIPHADVIVMTPYLFVRVLWYFNRRRFEAHPSTYETGDVLILTGSHRAQRAQGKRFYMLLP